MKRNLSYTQTNQGGQGVCGRHAFSRVIVKNFFELILPLQAHPDEEKKCNRFLKTAPDEYELDDDSVDMRELTPNNCSFSGYIKILLFLHLFFLFQTYIPTVEGRGTGWLECLQVSHLYEHFYNSIEIPNITLNQNHDLKDILYTLKDAQERYTISLVTFHFKDITFDNIMNITSHGLYIMLRIESSTNKTETHAAHFVIIVGSDNEHGEYIFIKNSWGDNTAYPIKFGYPFFLGSNTYDTLTDCSFVIPVQQSSNEDFQDLTHVDEYLQKYDALKTKFNKITTNVMNACPSENKEPVACDEINTFTKQSEVFDPSKNPRCTQEAEAKFQKLNALCNPNKLLLIGQGTRKSKGKLKTRRKRTRRT